MGRERTPMDRLSIAFWEFVGQTFLGMRFGPGPRARKIGRVSRWNCKHIQGLRVTPKRLFDPGVTTLTGRSDELIKKLFRAMK